MNSLHTSDIASAEESGEAARKQLSILFVMPETKLFAGEDFTGSAILTLAKSLTTGGA